MKLMIVDDEDIIREGLLRNIAWQENGFELTTPGTNGQDAIDIIGKEHPDIMLADINMPYMNGLELAQWVKDHHPEIKVIFLTGYNEFQYAQKAVHLQASGYLMKYEKQETLLQEVKRVADELEKDRDGKRLQSQARHQITLQTVSDLIIGIAKLNSRDHVLRQLGMDKGNNVYCFAIIDVSLNTPVNEEKPNENGLYLFSYINAVREVCREYADQVICGSYDNQIYAIFAAPEESGGRLAGQAKAAILKAQEQLVEFLKVQTKAG